ncbi:uncharacterized protein [Coffea arabica]|uniref:Uncharacterized protein isoform X2 n=1 Tax=Coffea arabica TaxID=13443 RepID=A0ABM4VXX3_COFAR
MPPVTRHAWKEVGDSAILLQSQLVEKTICSCASLTISRRGTGMGWDSTNYTFMMDDGCWADLLQVNKGYGRFYDRSCLVFYLLEAVFMNQGATGDYSPQHELSPLNSEEELEMENAMRGARGKDFVDVGSSDEDVTMPSTRKGKGKGKAQIGRHVNRFILLMSNQFRQYIRALDSIENLRSI